MILFGAHGVNALRGSRTVPCSAPPTRLGSRIRIEAIRLRIPSRAGPTKSNATSWRRWIAFTSAAAGLALGCATDASRAGPGSVASSKALEADWRNAPDWVTGGCHAQRAGGSHDGKLICGVGSATASRNRVAARETAIARARAAMARGLQVTIESLVRLEDSSRDADESKSELRTIVQQLSSASLPASRVVATWIAPSGAVHALVSLEMAQVQQAMRQAPGIPRQIREDLARRAGEALAISDRRFDDRE